ncbi:tetratricopeptide repeat protein [Massilia sp. LXY-6]|uniref:tetratricopeptide repeat protein n=1 Tax=Massilia sp. LXY-6 TaxID=3379823 RepID=UPI003EDEC04D
MSLINKMLQDLDARGTPGADSFPPQIRPVARARASLPGRANVRTIAAASGGAVATLALAWYGWTQYGQAPAADKPRVAAASAAGVARPAPAPITPAQGMSSTITVGTANAGASAPPLAVPAPLPAPVAPAPEPLAAGAAAPAAAPARPARRDDAPAAATADKHAARKAAAPEALTPAARPKSVAGFEPDSEEARAARQAIMAQLQARMEASALKPRARKAATLAAAGADAPGAAKAKGKHGGADGRQESASQRAEGEYRRALASLQDGRVTETVAALEQVLRLDPGHDAARQTLVGLLIEAKRGDEAIRHLQAGLALNVRQPALAMLLARMQIERGGSGIETLTRTLPYAGSNADYHAFLAGALQRDQRYREASEQYHAALRAMPGNGVWWMGLGMSLQAEKRNAEAQEAFQRARASGTLSAELQAFVERRLQQLSR